MKKVFLTILLIVLSFAAAGCGRKHYVGICLRYGESDASSRLETDLKDVFGAEGYQVAVWDAGNDQSRQNAQISRALEDGCDLMILEPVMTVAAEEILAKAMAVDVPVIFVNYEPESSVLESWAKAYYIGSDLTQPGRLQTVLVNRLPDGGDRNGDGSVAYTVIAGPEDHMDAVRWTRDCGSGLSRLEAAHGDWSRDSGRLLCRRQLAHFGDSVEVIFCNSDELALGALEALQSEEKEVYLVGIGGDPEALQKIREGNVTGTVCPDTKGLAACISETAATILNGGEASKVQLLDFLMVTKDTIQ